MQQNKKGFTLIELLVVVALLGVLTTLLMANFNAARQRSRDTQRKSDLKNVQTALRLYYNDLGNYPENSSAKEIAGCGSAGTAVCAWGEEWSVGSTLYMSTLPEDPTPAQIYRYTQIDLDTYTLQACLENKSDPNGVETTETGWCTSGWMFEVKP
jgi:prepilin-type N-terminal cleavage/methylation domain-containing protein